MLIIEVPFDVVPETEIGPLVLETDAVAEALLTTATHSLCRYN